MPVPSRPDDVTVSVALCTYNGARYVAAQVHSILSQSHAVQQIVVSDDGSTDGTVAIVEELVRHAPLKPDLVVLRNERQLGVTRNFQQALDACAGDLIALCDQDDVWRRDRVAAALDAMLAHPTLLLTHSDARLVDAEGRPLGITLFEALEAGSAIAGIHEGLAFPVFLRRNFATGATMMLRRDLLARVEPFPATWVHDEWLAITASILGGVDVLEAPLIDYRQHGANEIGMSAPSWRQKVSRVLEPRGQRTERMVARAESLVRWIEDRPDVLPEYLRAAEDKLAHERFRQGLPRARVRRVLPVIRELRAGRYDRLAGRGRLDSVRDLLQPHTDGEQP
jgi:glycosyltransferase involved in cell wall biosynthesis